MRTAIFFSAAVALAVTMAIPGPMFAQDTSSDELKTVLTVSLAGYDGVMESVDALAKVAGVPEMTMIPKRMLGGPEGPGGLDGAKPLGLIVRTDGQKFPILAFLPVTDEAEFVKFLEGLVRDVPEPDADGVYEVQIAAQTVFIQQKDGWAFAVLDRATLANTPADPPALLDGMDKDYVVAIRAQVANIPKEMRDSAMQIMQFAASAGSTRNEGETEQQYALRTSIAQESLKNVQKLANELDSMTIGLAVDATDGTIDLDFVVTAVDGTSLADEIADMSGLKSDFIGFFDPDAALTLRVTGKVSESDVTRSLQMLDSVTLQAKEAIDAEDFDEAQTRLALELAPELVAVIKDTIEGRGIDGGLSFSAGDEGVALIAGGHVVGAGRLEEIFKKLVDEAKKEEPDVDQFLKMNVAQHESVRFHTLTLPAGLIFQDGVPPAYADTDVMIAVGFGESEVYLAHGRDPVALLKKAIDKRTDAEVVPMRFSLSASGFGRLLEALVPAKESDIPPEVIAVLKEAGDKDHLLITSKGIPLGMEARMTIQGGLLKAIGAAIKAGVEQSDSQ